MSIYRQRLEAESLFSRARRVLSGKEVAPEAPEEPIDMRTGIDRALRQLRRTASQPSSLQQQAASAVAAIEGTLVAIDSIHECLGEALSLTAAALAEREPAKRAMLAARFEELRQVIDTTAADASFEGVNLIDDSRDAIEIILPSAGAPRLSVGHITLVAGERGLALKSPADQFADQAEAEAAGMSISAARIRLERATQTLLNEASVIAPHLGGRGPGTGA